MILVSPHGRIRCRGKLWRSQACLSVEVVPDFGVQEDGVAYEHGEDRFGEAYPELDSPVGAGGEEPEPVTHPDDGGVCGVELVDVGAAGAVGCEGLHEAASGSGSDWMSQEFGHSAPLAL